MTKENGFSRRQVLKTTASIAAGAATMKFAPGMAQAQTPELNMWWWGEQELPGLQGYVDDSVKSYTAASVKPMLQDTAVVISQFQTAAAAGKAPGHPVPLERHLPYGKRLAWLSAPP